VNEGWIRGAAAGIVTPERTTLAGWGKAGSSGPAVDPRHTVFSVGSLTKIVAATVLAELVGEGRCALDVPVEEYLPAGTVIPRFKERRITLLDLATHSSGLPAKAPFMATLAGASGGPADGAARLLEFLAGYTLIRAPGSGYEYSNVGFGLLGLAMSRITGKDFETMVQIRIAGPLGLNATRVVTDPALRSRVAEGFTADGDPVPFRDHAYAGASGSLRSTVPDLLAFLSLHLELGHPPDTLAAAARLTQEPRFETGPGVSRGLGWVVEHKPRIIWHTGAIAGCRSFFGFVPSARTGLALLTNSANPAADALGLQALRAAAGLPADLPRPPKVIAVPAVVLNALAGAYRMGDGGVVTVQREGPRLIAAGGPLGRAALYPTSATAFIAPAFEGYAEFIEVARGSPRRVRIHAWGAELLLDRIGRIGSALAALRAALRPRRGG